MDPSEFSICGVSLGQEKSTLEHLLADVVAVDRQTRRTVEWILNADDLTGRWPYDIRFVDGRVSKIHGRSLVFRNTTLPTSASELDVLAGLPRLKQTGDDRYSILTEQFELSVHPNRDSTCYILSDLKLCEIWAEEFYREYN